MSYKIWEMSAKAKNVFEPRLSNKLQNWPPERSLKKDFPFADMKPGQCFLLRDYETTPNIYTRCREFVARYNRMYKVHFVILRHDKESLYEVARIV